MAQVIRRQAELAVKLALLAVMLLLVLGVGLAVWQGYEDPTGNEVYAQPIPFSHKHHAGDDGIDCRYCHTTVEKAAFAGLPSTQICLSCHSQLYTDAAVLAPLRESARTGVPIAWNKVHRLPDFVYFNHSIHVARGVACIECHGRVDQMPLMRRVAPLNMKWCVECHRNPQPHLGDPAHVVSMDPHRVRDPEALRMLSRLLSEQRLTDCSTCHR